MRRSFKALMVVGIASIGLVASQALAATIPVTNPSFENPPLADGVPVLGVIGWVTSNPSMMGTFNPTTAHFTNEAPDGFNTAFANNDMAGTISQVLTATLQPNVEYVLQVEVGARLDFPYAPSAVQFLAGGVVKAQVNAPTPPTGGFTTVTVVYSALADDPDLGEPLEIRLVVNAPTGPLAQVNWDDVRLTALAVAPAPAASHAALLAMFALLTIFGARRVRRSPI